VAHDARIARIGEAGDGLPIILIDRPKVKSCCRPAGSSPNYVAKPGNFGGSGMKGSAESGTAFDRRVLPENGWRSHAVLSGNGTKDHARMTCHE
jgi:hypothetical protein